MPRALELEEGEFTIELDTCERDLAYIIKLALGKEANKVINCIERNECVISVSGKVISDLGTVVNSIANITSDGSLLIEIAPLALGG